MKRIAVNKYEIFHHQNMLVSRPNWLVCIYNFSTLISFLLKSTPTLSPPKKQTNCPFNGVSATSKLREVVLPLLFIYSSRPKSACSFRLKHIPVLRRYRPQFPIICDHFLYSQDRSVWLNCESPRRNKMLIMRKKIFLS